MKFLGMVAHLFHSFKSDIAFIANIQSLFMRDLTVLHQILNLAELPATCFTFVLFKQVSSPPSVAVVPTLPA